MDSPVFQTTPEPAVIIPSPAQNGVDGHSYGGEVAVQWRPLDRWQLRASYSCLKILLHAYKPDPFDFAGDEFTSPHQTVRFNSALRLTRKIDLDTALRFVDAVPYYSIPSYVELDARLAWQSEPNLGIGHWSAKTCYTREHAEYKPAIDGSGHAGRARRVCESHLEILTTR